VGLAAKIAFEQSGPINASRAAIEGLNDSLARIGVSADAATQPLRAVGLTAEQSSRAVLVLTNAGAKQGEIFGAAAFAYDLARRRQIDFGSAAELVAKVIESGNPKLAREIGLLAAFGDASLTAEQRSRAFAAALANEGAAMDAF